MKEKASATGLILVLFLLTAAWSRSTRFAYAQNTYVLINVGGYIVPPTAPIQRDGDLYTLTGDVAEITIARNNITLDGNGHTVSPPFATEGVILSFVKNVTVKNLIVKAGAYGIFLRQASNVTLSNNTVIGTSVPFPQSQGTSGIYVLEGGNNVIVGNRIENNYKGITIRGNIEQNIIVENNITSNYYVGMILWNVSHNLIYHNNFIKNIYGHVYDEGTHYGFNSSLNTWDNGKEGNFWSDYNGTDENGDGIGEPPYKVDSNNQDRYPLMKSWNANTPIDTVAPRILVSSPESKPYNVSSVVLTFSTNESPSKMFCSIDGQDNITIAGNTTLTGLSNGYHNVTVYATDETGNTGASETIYFNVDVPKPFPTTLVVATAVTAAVFGIGLLINFKKRHTKSGDKT
jgi:parallel beta-helix repeat protein